MRKTEEAGKLAGMRKTGDVSRLTGMSKRTLQHYDAEGLLEPKRTESNYRVYSDEDVKTLFVIKLFRDLGYGLKEIKDVVLDPDFDIEQSLDEQIRMLEQERMKITKKISLAKEFRRLIGEDGGPNTGDALCALLRHPEYAWVFSSGDDDEEDAEMFAYFDWLNRSYADLESAANNRELETSLTRMIEESNSFGASTEALTALYIGLLEHRGAGGSADSEEAGCVVGAAYEAVGEVCGQDPFAMFYLIAKYYGTGELTPPPLLAKMDDETRKELEDCQLFVSEAVRHYLQELEMTEERAREIEELNS